MEVDEQEKSPRASQIDRKKSEALPESFSVKSIREDREMFAESDPNPLEENVVSQIIDSFALAKYAAKESDWAKIEGILPAPIHLNLRL
ncbi:MAG: hypothetical protein JRN20_07765 [Nitrososphaerota archaeon]|nr:hypothetical protein [Nitrososphaerota archaeon]MDG6922667.1 hypothetical protein [Nitrososphaerota archaeon]